MLIWAPGRLPYLGSVSVLDDGEFAHGINSEELAADAAGVLLISEALVNSTPFRGRDFPAGGGRMQRTCSQRRSWRCQCRRRAAKCN